MDHWKNECPERNTGRDNKSGGERKTNAGGGGGVLGPSGNLPTNPTGAGGSNCSCIKNEVAEKLGLWGDPVTLELGTVNGEVELLIGSEVAHLHPQYQETVGRMVVRKSIFGTGWVLNGAHEDIACAPVDFNGNLQIIRTGCFRSNRVVVSYKQDMQFFNTMSEKEFFAAESLGCEPPRRCQDCRGCQECRFGG